ncbi:MAG: UDP-N-acetylmuramoyl-L-alanyl-D-glutamate--2,6-diaminopimelate ligase [Micrococcales bacterium]|nr:UDP-N-acetylmuramoyl-L-alanyl-D-glutamate--2,6-diaminopimelate ligase [Micrococcales bacterium]NBR60335.1 UDP-N-acetylmuramoyl-L-alanyl-D-glutamate--2,6-diaminopimelate ligase [Actinomycetota bacterium]NBT46233.1 UDP-N-acetylmuramoyl-L-alanyl-D-glutamate--2,6-diaminopimelate ligase [Actinomycetota bacterium]NBY43505.1 UDP-N-acetylmuramoyl-L-alanyl-D-glutamate--2,6-diaminopimelate ligase [Micrococcales bacterium]
MEINQAIPPILRPNKVKPISFRALTDHFSLSASVGEAQLTGISMNTADLRPGDLFVAMPGLKTHGAKYLAKAVELGAVAVISDREGLELIGETDIPSAQLENPREHLGELAAFVYGNEPGNMPLLFGTTGTNGKTSTTYLLEAILRQIGRVTGLTSTAERHIAGEIIVSRLTTPESTEMHALIARMREKGVTDIAIEVSAQALTQLRVDGMQFDVVGFTNLTHDHFDDYDGFEDYLRAKAKLFTKAKALRGVVCLDTEYGQRIVELSEVPTKTISSVEGVVADWKVTVTAELPDKTEFNLTAPDGTQLATSVPLLGSHMALDAGLAIAMIVEAGYSIELIKSSIAEGIEAYLPGRTELVSPTGAPNVYVDFGHSPDAFAKTLAAVRKVTTGKVLMLFGADGDRDASKRPDMAKVAADGCDILVITDHHPRFENPANIRKILVESASSHRPELEVYEVSSPEAAIRLAVSLVSPGDAILWAGPGHQDYRDIEGVRTPYSARAEARAALAEAGYR